MSYVQLGLQFKETDKGLALKFVTIDHNDTGLQINSELIKKLCNTILKGLESNKESIEMQDMLRELGIHKLPNDEDE